MNIKRNLAPKNTIVYLIVLLVFLIGMTTNFYHFLFFPTKEVKAATTHTDSFTADGTYTWTAPSGITSIKVETWGHGGHGGNAHGTVPDAGGGGGGGAYSMRNAVPVTGGTGYTVFIGTGGSYFNNNTTVYAQNGVNCNSVTGTVGGQAANGVGDVRYSGGNGGNGRESTTAYGGGGGGAAGSSGNGGNGTNATDSSPGVGGTGTAVGGGNGGNGSGGAGRIGLPAGGGGSGAARRGVMEHDGGHGAPGRVDITYTVVPPTVTTKQPDIPSTGGMILKGNVSAGGGTISEMGFKWNAGPTCNDTNIQTVTVTTGDYSWTMLPIPPNTQYSYRAYAINEAGPNFPLSTCISKYTSANKPNAPGVIQSPTSTTSLIIIIDRTSNPPATQFAISCDSDTTFLNYSTNACEAIADNANFWRTYDNWGGAGGFVDRDLTVGNHTYKVMARNGDKTNTALSAGTSISPLTRVPTTSTLKTTVTPLQEPTTTNFQIFGCGQLVAGSCGLVFGGACPHDCIP